MRAIVVEKLSSDPCSSRRAFEVAQRDVFEVRKKSGIDSMYANGV